jgi:hypothetical protein
VVRTLDGAEVAAPARLHELVAAVAADVVEPPEVAAPISDEKDPLLADPQCLLIARCIEVVGPPDAGPGSLEEPLLFQANTSADR